MTAPIKISKIHTGKYGFLSSYQQTNTKSDFANLVIDGVDYRSVEHYYQSQKFPHDIEYQNKIKSAISPGESRMLGRDSSKATIRPQWDSIKVFIMTKGFTSKFILNPKLRDRLENTADRKLIMTDQEEKYWSVQLPIILTTIRTVLRKTIDTDKWELLNSKKTRHNTTTRQTDMEADSDQSCVTM
jgi:ribA/ribD-fused uncharacterized protein